MQTSRRACSGETLQATSLRNERVARGIRIQTQNLCFLGFGNVNRTLVRLLQDRADRNCATHTAFPSASPESLPAAWAGSRTRNGLDSTHCLSGAALVAR